jgi:hypothetical protein
MKVPNKIFWTSLALYLISFFLIGVGDRIGIHDRSSPWFGFICAYMTLLASHDALRLGLQRAPFEGQQLANISMIISGWINPGFVLSVFLDLAEQNPKTVFALKVTLLGMIAFTVLFFITNQNVYPREGYFLWVASMLMTMFSSRFSASDSEN